MEIAEYMRSGHGRRLWILVIPVVLTVLSVAWAEDRPPEFETSATAVVQPSSGYSGPALIRQVVDGFVAVGESSTVADRVARELGVTPATVRDSVAVDPVGASALVEVKAIASDSELSSSMAQAIIRESFALTLESLIAQTRVELDAVRADAAPVSQRMDDAEAASGRELPPDAYRSARNEVQRIRALLAQGGESFSGGEVVTKADLRDAKRVLSERLVEYREYLDLQRREGQKLNQIAVVEARLAQYEARQEDLDGVVFESQTAPISHRAFVVQVAVGAAVLGLLLGVVLLLAIEFVGARQRRLRSPSANGAATVGGVQSEEAARAAATAHGRFSLLRIRDRNYIEATSGAVRSGGRFSHTGDQP